MSDRIGIARRWRWGTVAVLCGAGVAASVGAMFPGTPSTVFAEAPQQSDPRTAPAAPPKASERVERIGPNLLRIGNVQVDTAAKRVAVRGTVNDVFSLEFVANAENGFKAYESALELDTSAINFNLALILIGLDSANAVPPRYQFDPALPKGDPVEIWIEWEDNGTPRRVSAEQLVYNRSTKNTLTDGPWIYTGSVFSGERGTYLAEMEGTLIGFMHTPSSILENPRALPGAFGNFMVNPDLNLKPGTSILVTVRALPRAK